VIDGPFPRPRVIAGFWLWQVRSIEGRSSGSKRCPSPHEGEAEIEIRQVFEAEDFGFEATPELQETGKATARPAAQEAVAATGTTSHRPKGNCLRSRFRGSCSSYSRARIAVPFEPHRKSAQNRKNKKHRRGVTSDL